MQTPSRRPTGTAQRPVIQRNPTQPSSARPVTLAGSPPDRGHLPDGKPPAGVMRAMSPGVVDYLFRQLVTGASAEDLSWQLEGVSLSGQAAGPELARRLAETDLEALTPAELFHYVREAQRLASWAEGLREVAVQRYCEPGAGPLDSPGSNGAGPGSGDG